MADRVQILDIKNIWNTPCGIENGDILEVTYCYTKRRILFVKKGENYNEFGEEDNLVRDENDCMVWADQSDVNRDYLMFL